MKAFLFIIIASLPFQATTLLAFEVSVSPHEIQPVDSIAFSGNLKEDDEPTCSKLKIKVIPSCYISTRSVHDHHPSKDHKDEHPMSPWARLKMRFSIKSGNAKNYYMLKFPARFATRHPDDIETRKALCRPILRDLCNASTEFGDYIGAPIGDGGDGAAGYNTFNGIDRSSVNGNCHNKSDNELLNDVVTNRTLQYIVNDNLNRTIQVPFLKAYFLNLWANQQHCYTDEGNAANKYCNAINAGWINPYSNKCQAMPNLANPSGDDYNIPDPNKKTPLRYHEVTFRKATNSTCGDAGDKSEDDDSQVELTNTTSYGHDHTIRVDSDCLLTNPHDRDGRGDLDPKKESHHNLHDDIDDIEIFQDFIDDDSPKSIALAPIPSTPQNLAQPTFWAKNQLRDFKPPSEHMGTPGKVSFRLLRKKRSNDGSEIELRVAFPAYREQHFDSEKAGHHSYHSYYDDDHGAYCGAYFTPLMLFFDHRRPEFKNHSQFLTGSSSPGTYWPEANSPGYFLAYDPTGLHKVTNKNNLFTETSDQKSAFEQLKKLAPKGTKKITPASALWKKLFLWQDKNSNSIQDPGETFTLAEKGILWISLDYKVDKIYEYGSRAEENGESEFAFKETTLGQGTGDPRKIETQKAKMIDVWFSAYFAEEQ